MNEQEIIEKVDEIITEVPETIETSVNSIEEKIPPELEELPNNTSVEKYQVKSTNLPSLQEMSINDNKIMKLLRVGEMKHIIAHTDKGDFCLCLFKGGSAKDYRFVLDAVPVEAKENKELLNIFNGVLFTL